MEDAESIKLPLQAFIHRLNAAIGNAIETERTRKTRIDLVVTLVVGGLSFTLANVFVLLNHELGLGIPEDEYEKSFLKMYRTALKDIQGKNTGMKNLNNGEVELKKAKGNL